jgi:hypothetical protein
MKGKLKMNVTSLKLEEITLNAEVQPRITIDDYHVDEYTEEMLGGAVFPPGVVFFDGTIFWLADGFHRYKAHLKAGKTEMMVEIRKGGKREAMLHSVGANAAHGKRRTNDDKRKAVETLFKDEEWSGWSDHEIAKACRVSQPFVSGIRKTLVDAGYQFPPPRKCANRREMDVSQIGSNRAQESQEAQGAVEGTSEVVQQTVTTTEAQGTTGEDTAADHSSDATPEVVNPEAEASAVGISEPAVESQDNISALAEAETDDESADAAAGTAIEEVSQVEVHEAPVQEPETTSPEVDDDISTLKVKVAELQAALQAKELELQMKDKIIKDLAEKVRELEEENAYYLKEFESYEEDNRSKNDHYSYATASQL